MRAGALILLLVAFPLALKAGIEPSNVEENHLWAEVDWLGTLSGPEPLPEGSVVIFHFRGHAPQRERFKLPHLDLEASGFFAVRSNDDDVAFIRNYEERGHVCAIRAAGQIERLISIREMVIPLVRISTAHGSAACFITED